MDEIHPTYFEMVDYLVDNIITFAPLKELKAKKISTPGYLS
jgi:hypothetical protein